MTNFHCVNDLFVVYASLGLLQIVLLWRCRRRRRRRRRRRCHLKSEKYGNETAGAETNWTGLVIYRVSLTNCSPMLIPVIDIKLIYKERVGGAVKKS